MRGTRHRSSVIAAIAALALLAGVMPAGASHPPEPGAFPSPDTAAPDLDRLDPVRFAYEDAIVEHVQVPSRNGRDQLWVDIIRPDTDEPVPTIMMPSPYYNTLGRGWRAQLKVPHQGPSYPTSPGVPFLSGDEETMFPEWYDEYFVPRGYAYVAMDLRGTRNSSGCQVYGDRDEVFDVVDVVDWVADQEWSNGAVGLTGGSYDGTIAIGAAAEQPISGRHPDAVKAIIPIRAIDRWYDYHFFNGVQSLGHSATPALFTAALAGSDTQNSGTDDVLLPLHFVERKACIATVGAAVDAGYASPYQNADDPFWTERSFVKDADGFRAATFVIHGLFDFNVKTNNAGHLWEALPDDLPRKLWLFNGDHADPHLPTAEDAQAGRHILPFPFRERFVEATHRWFLQFLKDVEAGALTGPRFEVQQADGRWRDGGAFPASVGDEVLRLTPDGTATTGSGSEGEVTWADGPTSSAPAEATFLTAPFTRDTRLSGQVAFDLDLAVEGTDTTVAVDIVAVPPGIDRAATPTETMDGSHDAPLRIAYGWARAWYRDTIPLRGLPVPSGGGPMTAGERTELRFGSLYTDVVVPAGHRLRFRFSNAAGGTIPSEQGGTVTLFTGPDASRILLPVAPEPGPPSTAVARHAGADRVGTAAAVSRASYGHATTVLVATSANYPDALAGGPLATHLAAPLVLTAPGALSPETADEIGRLGATEAVVLGGPAAVSDEVVAELEALGLTVRRVSGDNRFGTAAAVAAELPESNEVLIAEGAHVDPARGWPDALSASTVGATIGAPVLLVTKDVLPDQTAGALDGLDTATIVGGPNAVSPKVADAIATRTSSVRRIAGTDRYATSVAAAELAQRRGAGPGVTWVATGRNWPDGLTASAAAARADGVLLLVDSGSSAGPAWIERHRDDIRVLHLAGGPAAISPSLEAQLRGLVA